jgi:hypothetical protein
MHARLNNGPGDTQEFDVGKNPPPTAYFCSGGKQFPATVDRYKCTEVRPDRTPEPRATYQHVERL